MAGVGNAVPEELDIYEDLIENDDFEATDFIAEKLNNVETLKSENSELKGRLTELEAQMEVSKRQNDILKRNISKLYKTAKLEISRKDLLLSDLQRRYDQLLFKRSKKNGEHVGNPIGSSASFRNQNSVVGKQKEQDGNILSDFPSNQMTIKVGDNRTNRADLKTPNVVSKNNRETCKRDVIMDVKTCSDILGNINDAQKIFKMVHRANKDEKKIANKINLKRDSSAKDNKECSFRSNEVVECAELKCGSSLVGNQVLINSRELLSVRNGEGDSTAAKERITSTENHERQRTADSKYKNVDNTYYAADRKTEDIRSLSTKSSPPMSNVKRKEFNGREHLSSAKKRSRSRSPSKSRLWNHGCERGSRERNDVDRTRSRQISRSDHLNHNSDNYRTHCRDSSHRSSNAKHSQQRRK